jgi:hypothetical protein
MFQADQARWQRRAAAELAAILDGHGDLPCIAWTVGPAGSVLAGQVNGLASAARVRETFGAWRAALALEEHAAARLHHVKVRLTATVFDGEEEDQ